MWFENHQLIEYVTADLPPDYLATFGPANREHLDGQLRALKQMFAVG